MWGICTFGFIHTPGKTHYYVLSASSSNFGRCPAPVKSFPWKTFVSSSVLSPVSECSSSAFSGSLWPPASATSYRVHIIIKIFLYSVFFIFWTNQSNHHHCVFRPHHHHCHKLDDWSRNHLEIVHGRRFLFRIPTKDIVVLFYSTLSPQTCTKLNTEKHNAQGHLGSNVTPERENRNFRKTVITNSTKPLCRPRGHLSQRLVSL